MNGHASRVDVPREDRDGREHDGAGDHRHRRDRVAVARVRDQPVPARVQGRRAQHERDGRATQCRTAGGSSTRRAAGRLHVEHRRVAELAELRRVAAEEEVHRPVDDQSQLAAGPRHHREVVGAGQEPGREPAPLDADGLRDRLLVAHVDEDAERLVVERLRLARRRARPRRCRPRSGPGAARAGRSAASAGRVARGRARRRSRRSPRRCRAPRRGSSGRPRSGRPDRAAGPSRATTGAGRTPAVQATVRHGTTSPSDSSTESAEMRSTVVPVRTSIPRLRSSAVANSARSAEISGITRSRASTRMKRRPSTRARG